MEETRACQVTLYHPEFKYTDDHHKSVEIVPAKFLRWGDGIYRGESNDLPITKAIVELEDGTIVMVDPESVKMSKNP